MTKENEEMQEIAEREAKKVVDLAIAKTIDKVEGYDSETFYDLIMKEEGGEILYSLIMEAAKKEAESYKDSLRELIDKQLEQDEGENAQIKEFLQAPEQIKYGNTKVENVLMKPEFDLLETIREREGKFDADIASRDDRAKGDIYKVEAEFSLPPEITLPEGFNYSLSKRAIVNTIGNAYDQAELETHAGGAKTIRADHLMNMMNGDDLTTDVRPETIEELIKSIEPLTTVRVEIDASDHQEYNRRSRKKIQMEQNKFTGYLLPVEIFERKEFSKSKQVYLRILSRPVLYQYAVEAGQVMTFKRETLDLTTAYLENGTEERTIVKQMNQQRRAIRDFILIQLYGRGRNYKVVPITYSSIREAIEKDAGKKLRAQTVNGNIEKVVLALQQKNEIKKYEIVSKGRINLYRIDIYRN